MFGFIFSLLIGALAGSIAGRIMGSETSALRNIVLGILGSFVGGILPRGSKHRFFHRRLCLHLGWPQAVPVSSPS